MNPELLKQAVASIGTSISWVQDTTMYSDGELWIRIEISYQKFDQDWGQEIRPFYSVEEAEGYLKELIDQKKAA